MENRKDNGALIGYDKFLKKREEKNKNSIKPNITQKNEYIELMRYILDELEYDLDSDGKNKNDEIQKKSYMPDDEVCINLEEKDNLEDSNGCSKSECEELRSLKVKVNAPIPKAILVYIVFSAMAFASFLTIFFIAVTLKIVVLDLVSCIVGIISTGGLLATALVAIKDWRKFVRDV